MSPKDLHEGLEKSLKNLGTDYIDIFKMVDSVSGS